MPLYGDRGTDISGVNRWTKTVTVPLASGANQITLRAENAHGAVSLRDEMHITCTAEPETQDLYVVAVSVSKYSDATYNLTYADQDAADMSAMISGKSSRPGKVHALGISDREFDHPPGNQPQKNPATVPDSPSSHFSHNSHHSHHSH